VGSKNVFGGIGEKKGGKWDKTKMRRRSEGNLVEKGKRVSYQAFSTASVSTAAQEGNQKGHLAKGRVIVFRRNLVLKGGDRIIYDI